jgi:hypothetical protein
LRGFEFTDRLIHVNGSGTDDTPSHEGRRELMYQVCPEVNWWDWISATFGREEFPIVPLLRKKQSDT